MADVWGLPTAQSLSAQNTQGQDLLHTAESAIGGSSNAAQSLLSAGVTLASSAVSGGSVGTAIKVGFSLVNLGIAVASGAAVGGPIGAVAGAVSQLVSSVLTGGGATLIVEPSEAAKQVYANRQAWSTTGHAGGLTGKPQGWTLADYLASKYPAKTTKRAGDLWLARSTSWAEFTAANQAAGQGDTDSPSHRLAEFMLGGHDGVFGNGALAFVQSAGVTPWSAKIYAAMVQTVATELLFHWGELTEDDFTPSPKGTPTSLAKKDDLGVLVAMPSVSDLHGLARNDIIPLTSGKTTLSRAEIWKSAIDRRPDALYWDADLYIWNYTTGGTFSLTEKSWTTLYNLEALNMLSTWCAMLQAGASTRAILSELLLQQYSIASQSGDGSVPYLCRMLVEDCLTMARQEWKETKAGQMKRPQATLHTDYLSTKIAPTSKTQAAALAAGLASLPAPVDSGGLALAAGGVLAAGAAGGLWWWLR